MWTNPHLRLIVDWHGQLQVTDPTDPGWVKWRPSEPTSPHWYQPEHLERLVAAYVTHEAHAGMSVREFVTGFRGLTGSAKGKQVLAQTGMARTMMADLANGRARLGRDRPAAGRDARALPPGEAGPARGDRPRPPGGPARRARLRDGLVQLQEDPRRDRLAALGRRDRIRLVPGSRPSRGSSPGSTGRRGSAIRSAPWAIRGLAGHAAPRAARRRRLRRGVHLACPRVAYTDRGKSAVVIR